MSSTDESRLIFHQLRSGRDFARNVPFAAEMANYSYVLGDRSSGEAILVDPAYDPAELVGMLAGEELRLVGVVLTHYHSDHAGGGLAGAPIAGIAELLEVADVPVHVQRDEVPWVARQTGVPESALFAHGPGDELRVGTLSFTLVHTPGHTPGSQCLLGEGRLLTGDTLFLRGCGRTDLPGGDPDALYDTLVHRLARLDPATIVFAGHDYDPARSATIGVLHVSNPVLAPRDLESWKLHFT